MGAPGSPPGYTAGTAPIRESPQDWRCPARGRGCVDGDGDRLDEGLEPQPRDLLGVRSAMKPTITFE